MAHGIRLLLVSIPLCFCISCTTVTVKPDNIAALASREFVLKANLLFEGNPAYIPKTIVNSKNSDIDITYEYKVFYDGTKLNHEIIAGLLPTTLLGLPTGGDDILVVAKLDIRKGGDFIKSYSAEALVTRPRSLFLGGVNKTAMRKKGLLAVQENLENQMMHDHELLSKLKKE